MPYSRTCRRDSQGTLCIRHLTDVPICVTVVSDKTEEHGLILNVHLFTQILW